jgi:hypothetical protein
VVVDRNHLKEFFDAPESSLSLGEHAEEGLQFEYTKLRYEHFNVPILRTQLTPNLPKLMDVILDEANAAFGEHLVVSDCATNLRDAC